MKHILKFVLQTLIVVFIFTPIVVVRYIWTFKWNDKFNSFPRGIYWTYKRSYQNFIRKINGLPVHTTF
jgi:hypothetical protein